MKKRNNVCVYCIRKRISRVFSHFVSLSVGRQKQFQYVRSGTASSIVSDHLTEKTQKTRKSTKTMHSISLRENNTVYDSDDQ